MEIREEIIRVAGNLFLQLGVKKVKMDLISQRLKVSKRTIYIYFKNKDSLIRSTCNMATAEQNRINRQIILEAGNTIEAVLGLLKNGSHLLSEINPAYFTDLQRLYPKIWHENIQQSKIHSYKHIYDLLKKGKQEGIYRESINEQIIAKILIEQLYMITDQNIFPPGEFSIVEVYENIVINITRGISTSKGLELLEKYAGSGGK
jgi:TetR/AcrR family transcriptional regulator, cholesterol catabolism regulator